ncbi:MAG TPA: sugar transferase [Gemmatirosa sp.]
MRRKLQPARDALPHTPSRTESGSSAGSPAGAADPGVGGVVGPLALDVLTPPDPLPTRPGTLDADRGARDRRHRHAAGHTWTHATVDLTAPATPVSLVRDPVDAPDESPSQIVAGAIKRLLDVVVAGVGLVVSAPLLLVLAALVRLSSPGPIFFAQARVGQGGRVFRCYKLRTMRNDAESLLRSDPELRATYERNGFKIPCDADHRVTGIGRFLRLTSCDEIPQLWNVLKGEMSLVGPRPLVARELSHYPGADRDLLLSVRPGLTGAWAVGGRSRVGYPRRAAMELDYVRHWSLGRDLRILFRTVGAVLARRGAA